MWINSWQHKEIWQIFVCITQFFSDRPNPIFPDITLPEVNLHFFSIPHNTNDLARSCWLNHSAWLVITPCGSVTSSMLADISDLIHTKLKHMYNVSFGEGYWLDSNNAQLHESMKKKHLLLSKPVQYYAWDLFMK